MDEVARHYGSFDGRETILEGLQAEAKDFERLTLEDLAPVDEMHIRGREATAELAELAGAAACMKVLDVGFGLGN